MSDSLSAAGSPFDPTLHGIGFFEGTGRLEASGITSSGITLPRTEAPTTTALASTLGERNWGQIYDCDN